MFCYARIIFIHECRSFCAGKKVWLIKFCNGTCAAWKAGLQLMQIIYLCRVGMRYCGDS